MSFRAVPDAAQRARPTRLGLWFGLLGGAVAWTLHLLLSYFTAEFGCESGLDRHVYLGVMLPAWILIGISLTTAALGAVATCVAWRLRRRFGPASTDPGSRGPDAYLARAGFLTSALFTAIIIGESLPIVYFLGSC